VITHLEPDILEREVKWALESITMNKASGGDGIPVELFQILKDDAVKVLQSICQQIWKTKQRPQDWKRSVFIPIPKKGNAKECSNYRTIALISHALFIVMLSKAHLTSHSRMSGSRSVITPLWLSGSWRSFLHSSSVYSCHLFLILPSNCHLYILEVIICHFIVTPLLFYSCVVLHWLYLPKVTQPVHQVLELGYFQQFATTNNSGMNNLVLEYFHTFKVYLQG